jgi:hypothetical protein
MESKFTRQQETRPFGKQFSRQEETRPFEKLFSWQQETSPYVSGCSLGCCDHNTLCVIVKLQPYGKRPLSMLFSVSMQASTTFVIFKKLSKNYQFKFFLI